MPVKKLIIPASLLAVITLFALAPHGSAAQGKTKKGKATAVKFAQVEKILSANCIGCHGDNRPRDGIDLRTQASVLKGGEDGPIVKVGKPADSVLVKAVHGVGARPMPPRGPKLTAPQIKVIESWIQGGAKA